jgi:glutamine amidotransferase
MSKPPRIALVDYGAGNLRSVAKALERSKLEVDITDRPERVASADGVVLPGVGAFADAMQSLATLRLNDCLRAALGDSRPYLGLCLGLQLLFEESDEHGTTRGFEHFPGRVERFSELAENGVRRRVPHIGWNQVHFEGDHPMLASLPTEDHFYFVHSYRAVPEDEKMVVGRADYEGSFAAAVASKSCFAAQFHPEKSQWAGKRMLDAYATWVRGS